MYTETTSGSQTIDTISLNPNIQALTREPYLL